MADIAVDAVTFDFWNTLCVEEKGHFRSRRLAAWEGLFQEAGVACERQRLDAVFEASWNRFTERWTAGEQYLAARAAEDILEDLGYDLPPDVREALVEAFTTATEEADVSLTAGAADTLRALRARGVRLGIICDVGMTPSSTLRRFLERHGVLDLFEHWSFSDEVGVYKPDRRIFEHALAGLGVADAGRAAHVGDLRRTDVAGALAMGMRAVRYAGVFDDPPGDGLPEGHAVIAHHRELVAALAGG